MAGYSSLVGLAWAHEANFFAITFAAAQEARDFEVKRTADVGSRRFGSSGTKRPTSDIR
jgi:hypothetical protein